MEEWPGGTLMHFSMDKGKAQQLGLSLPPPPQCYIWWIDCARAALQTQSWRMWQGGAVQVPMTPSVSRINSTLGYTNGSTGTTPREVNTPSAQHSSDHILITEASVGPFNTGQAQMNLGVQQRAPKMAGGWNICPVRRG